MPTPITETTDDLQPGDFYEDCAYHPCLCTRVIREGDLVIQGISLVDGSYPRECSIPGCGVRKLTFEEAMHWKFYGPADVDMKDEHLWCERYGGDAWQYWPEDKE